MASYVVGFYSTDPGGLIPTTVGGRFTWTGPAAFDGSATIADMETGAQGRTLDDDSAGGETATATVAVGGAVSADTTVDAEIVWTVRDTVTGIVFQIAEFDVEGGAAAGDYTLSERPLVPGRSYEVMGYESNPDVAGGDAGFDYLDFADAVAEPARVIDGGAGADVIDAGYAGDPEGDGVDDGTGTGPGGVGDVIDARGGDDDVSAGAGDDTVHGGAGADTIAGGAGDDTIHGDGPAATPATEMLSWAGAGAAGADVAGGFTADTGDMRIAVSFSAGPTLDYVRLSGDPQYVAAGESFGGNSSVLLASWGSTGGVATLAMDFAAETGAGLDDAVENVRFRINDLDWQPNDHRDQVTVSAWDAEGNPVAVTLTAGGGDTVDGATVTADDAQDATDAVGGTVLVEIAGPVARIEVQYDNVGTGASGVWIGDVAFDTLPITGGDDVIAGGAGDDLLYGEAGADTFLYSDGFGADRVSGGTGADTLDFHALSTGVSGAFSGDGAGNLGDGANAVAFSEIEAVALTGQDDNVDASASGAGVTLTGLGGGDRLTGGAGDDVLTGDGVSAQAGVWAWRGYDYDFSSADGQAFVIEAGTLAGQGTTDGFDVAGLIHEARGSTGDPDDFGVILTSTLTPTESGTFTFSLTSDDGSTLQIFDADGTPVSVLNEGGATLDYLDNDYHQAATTRSGTVTLTAGETYTVEVRYWENAGGNTLAGTVTWPSGVVESLAGSSLLAPVEAAGDDVLTGGAGRDLMAGGAGDDTLVVAEGDTATGGEGDDTFVVADYGEAGAGTIAIDGGEGDETTGDVLEFRGLLEKGSITYSNPDDAAGGLSGQARLIDGTVVNFTGIEQIICFTPGTRIRTPLGERPVETLAPGDMVITADRGAQPLRWVGRRRVTATGRFTPIRIRAGLFDNARDLVVSPQHRILYEGYRAQLLFGHHQVLVPAKHLVDHHEVLEEETDEVTYIHLLFDHHEIVFAEGARTESFHPGHVGLDAILAPAREELFAVFPELRAEPRAFGPTSRHCLKRFEARMLTTGH